tara:strand:+ start:3438 stop:3839 length:402 start_codon:yes stop_codon:yes gene_type:complete
MEIKKSVVTVTQPNGTWEGKYGLMYKFIIEFENGDRGSYLSKSETQNKFIIGNETEYEYTGGEYPKIKPHYANPTSNYSNKNLETRDEIRFSVAFKGAIDLASSKVIDIKDIKKKTIEFSEFLQNKKDDDLPF